MKRRNLAIIGLFLTASTVFTGCGSLLGENVESYPLESTITASELRDYYAKSLDYDSVVTRNIEVHDTEYETYDVGGEKAEKLKQLVSQIETILSSNKYVITDKTKKLLSKDNYDYMKATLDNESLSNGAVKKITGALGYYFVDVEYDIGPSTEGSFKDNAVLVGINGAFEKALLDNGVIKENSRYLENVADLANDYFAVNLIPKVATYNGSKFTVKKGDPTKNNSDFVNSSFAKGRIINPDEVKIDTKDTTAEEEALANSKFDIETPSSRLIPFNVAEINSNIASKSGNKALMPLLQDVYNIPNSSGLSGFGIYPAGQTGVVKYGFDRSGLTGKATIRYVFRDDSDGTGDIIGTNVYLYDENITNGPNISDNKVNIPDFLMQKLEETIDRNDRCIVDEDLAGLGSTNLYQDLGPMVLRGYKSNSTLITKYMSKIRQVINRDTTNNSYLLEVETTTTDGPRDVDAYGTYKDKAYVTIQQQNQKFIITDWIRVSRKTTQEPAINPDSNAKKRLTALNLAGEVNDDTKDSIKSLLSDLYTAGTLRVLNGPATVDDTKVKRGLVDCYSSDVSTLSSEDKEDSYIQLAKVLTREGADVGETYSGTVTGWIGGYENQAELTTEELVSFDNGKAYYMSVYYLMANQNDQWVITERKVMDQKEVTDAKEIDNIKERVGQK